MHSGAIKRCILITLLGAAAAWPLKGRAQQPAMPVIGFINPASQMELADRVAAFGNGLAEQGFSEGRTSGHFEHSDRLYVRLRSRCSGLSDESQSPWRQCDGRGPYVDEPGGKANG